MALSGLQQIHFEKMLHSLGVRPFQQTTTTAGFAADAVGRKPAIVGGYKGVVQEASEHPNLAYGFTLGLVYFRYLSVLTRYAWERSIRKAMSSYDDLSSYSVKLQDQTFHASASSKPQDHLSLMKKLEAIRSGGAGAERMADFCRTLLTKKISVFSANDDATVNSMERVLGNPWLMTNTEFAWSWEYERLGSVQTLSLPREQVQPPSDDGNAAAVAAQEWAKAGATEMTKAGIEHLAEALGLTAATIVFSPEVIIGMALASAIGVSLEEIKTRLAARAARRLNSYFQIEHDRRLWLSAVQWSDYKDIPRSIVPRGPAAPDIRSIH